MNTLIIGGGNMGKTYARSFLDSHVLRPNHLHILEIYEPLCEELEREGLGNIYRTPDPYINQMELIILAVKPQDAELLYRGIRPFLHENQVVLSIMAGVKLHTIEQGTGLKKIVRAMPNLPAQIGMGMTAFTARDEVSRKELINVQNLLSTTGLVMYLDDENLIDAATAVSGSGPAYVFYFMQAMMEAAQKIGFTEAQAELLVLQTFLGSVHLLGKKNVSCQEWIRRVASKGGTTEAALHTFEQQQLNPDIISGVQAAFERAKELGKLQ